MSLEGHQTGGSGHTLLLSFAYQMFSGDLPGAKSREKWGPLTPETGLQDYFDPGSSDLYRITC